MKSLKAIIITWFEKLNQRWRVLPLKRQRRYILLLFACYSLLSVFIMLKVCYDVGNTDMGIKVEHIENPVIPKKMAPDSAQDSIRKIFKNKLYGK